MSVLKSQRTLSRHEYVHTFEKLYKYTQERISKVSKRKYNWLCMPIINNMNSIYNHVMQINNEYFCYGIKLMDRKDQANLVINELKDLQKPLLALWNIEKYETKKMAIWSDMINEEIKYLSRLGGLQEGEVKHIFILDYKAVQEADFIRVMCELHKLIYSKTISLPDMARSTNGTLLMNLADEALYRVCHANRFVPTNKKMVENRKEDLSIAYDCIRQMQQPMISIFNIMNYSENTMIEMASKLDSELRLLKGVLQSDKKRFAIYNCYYKHTGDILYNYF